MRSSERNHLLHSSLKFSVIRLCLRKNVSEYCKTLHAEIIHFNSEKGERKLCILFYFSSKNIVAKQYTLFSFIFKILQYI